MAFFIAGAVDTSDGVVTPDEDGIVIALLLFFSSGIVIVQQWTWEWEQVWGWSSQSLPISIVSFLECYFFINQYTRQFFAKAEYIKSIIKHW